jgi:acyl carrier protein
MTGLFEQVRNLIADVLQVPESEITPETEQSDLANWDSLQHLNLMLSLEQEFGLALDVDELQRLTSVPAILTYLESV